MLHEPNAEPGTGLLEVIACSLEDALEAERGQADRLEVVRELDRGGLTPSLNLVKQIKANVRLPIRVMLRESEHDVRPSPEALKLLREALAGLAEIDVDGIVIGFLRDDEVDLETMAEVMNLAPRMPVTFHHAFDDTRWPLHTLERLRAMPQIDHVLTSGGRGDVLERAGRLERYCGTADEGISILVGGGVNGDVLRVLRAKTLVREFHVGRAARDPCDGKVKAHLVRELKDVLNDVCN